jgi:hypothetical protein
LFIHAITPSLPITNAGTCTSLSTSSIVPPSAAIVPLTGAFRAMPGF